MGVRTGSWCKWWLTGRSADPFATLATVFDWTDKTVLVTGGTGSFGQCAVRLLLDEYAAGKVIVYSRDELKQHEMRQAFPDERIRWFLGDVRDRHRLWRALNGVHIVIHAAALKQVPACQYNPIEAIRTNVDGTANVVDACLDRDVDRCMFISTDKAVDACTVYGSSKATAEHLTVAANAYAGTRFAAARYGNVLGSRGSVIPLWREQAKTGRVTVTDPDATRFWLTIDTGVRFVLDAITRMHGGEVFIPQLGASTIAELAAVVAPGADFNIIGLRAGEKQHERLVSENEHARTYTMGDSYIVWLPSDTPAVDPFPAPNGYSSDTARRLSADELALMIPAHTWAKSG